MVKGTPILLSDNGELDEWLVLYFNSCPEFTALDLSSRKTYAREIAMWCGFLGQQVDPITWLEATEEEFVDYKIRRTDQLHSANAVTGATWNKAVFALRGLYDWALSRKIPITPHGPAIDASPVPGGRGATKLPGVRANAAFVRTERDRWIVPGTYRLWRDVGLRGRGVQRVGASQWQVAGDDESCRARNSLRNTAFTDFIYSTGLRVQEAGSLLVAELPPADVIEAKLPAAVAKYGKARMWYAAPTVMRTVRSYMAVARAAAVRRAIRESRYDEIEGIIWVTEVRRSRKGTLEAVRDDGAVMSLNTMKPEVRRRLFWLRDGHPEPMTLWLSESGTPFHHESWIGIFDAANERLWSAIENTGAAASHELSVTPHSLRFSFALALTVQLHQRLDDSHGWDESVSYGDGSRYDEVFRTVKDVLGHKSVETTRNIYMPRVQRLRFDRLFGTPNGRMTTTGDLVSALAQHLVEVRDLTGSKP
ncbi:site-specific integrase [Mycobacterium sp. PSTR-4-N]|uniref:site-specific integrase n=1 Tax=Mycobacterium sp. PSTR-4-N TaxID=2917745 RepID=UPI001F1525CD|nr:site-specific integrase [Mycobacterium sp. PSTR-4-N]MCG7594596.1 site-specific integrase [Mycobacterium sp. PSTR-4-N]